MPPAISDDRLDKGDENETNGADSSEANPAPEHELGQDLLALTALRWMGEFTLEHDDPGWIPVGSPPDLVGLADVVSWSIVAGVGQDADQIVEAALDAAARGATRLRAPRDRYRPLVELLVPKLLSWMDSEFPEPPRGPAKGGRDV